jgi:prephenate dehydrogenase
MGRWFASFLVQDGKEVVISGRSEKRLQEAKQELGKVDIASNVEAVKNADVVLVSVPIDSFETVIKEICPYVRSEQFIIDLTSIKVFPVEIMHRYINIGLILGAHPMFGPGAKSMKNQNWVLTPTDEKELALAEKVKQYLETKGAKVTLMTPDKHDEMTAVILADTLSRFDQLGEMRTIAGTTYKVLLTLIKGVVSRDPEFYATLQMSLPDMAGIEEAFIRNSQEWVDLVRNRDKQEFIHKMQSLRNTLENSEPDLDKAYENVYTLLEDS